MVPDKIIRSFIDCQLSHVNLVKNEMGDIWFLGKRNAHVAWYHKEINVLIFDHKIFKLFRDDLNQWFGLVNKKEINEYYREWGKKYIKNRKMIIKEGRL